MPRNGWKHLKCVWQRCSFYLANLHSAYIAVACTVGTSQRRFSDSLLSSFGLQFSGKNIGGGEESLWSFEPSASKSLKTKSIIFL